MSATIWIDPQGRLWVFWGQIPAYRMAASACGPITTDDPDADRAEWSTPRRLGDGILLNKPTVLANGDWLLPPPFGKPTTASTLRHRPIRARPFNSEAPQTLPMRTLAAPTNR